MTKTTTDGESKGGSHSCTTALSFAAHVLYKIFALSGLALMAMLFSCAGARAGSWTYTIVGDNKGTSFTGSGNPGYIPDFPSFKDANGNATVYSGFSAGVAAYQVARTGYSSGTGCDLTSTISVQVTFIWKPADGLNSTTDPPPDNVLVQESATAFWSADSGDDQHPGSVSGSAANGLGDSEGDVMQSPYSEKGCSGPPPDQTYPTGSYTQHFKSYPVSNGTVTVDKPTVTAHTTVTSPIWYYGAKASVSYGASIHAQPYNMRLTPDGTSPTVYVDNIGGRLSFHYSISSTDGNVADLTSISAYETLDWSGNPAPPGGYVPGFYVPPSPPLAFRQDTDPPQPYSYNTPNKINFPSLLQGYMIDGFSPPTSGFVAPYPTPSTSWSATQNYLFDDSTTGEAGTKIPGPDNNSPFTITRTVSATNAAGTTGLYSISAHGHSALKSLP